MKKRLTYLLLALLLPVSLRAGDNLFFSHLTFTIVNTGTNWLPTTCGYLQLHSESYDNTGADRGGLGSFDMSFDGYHVAPGASVSDDLAGRQAIGLGVAGCYNIVTVSWNTSSGSTLLSSKTTQPYSNNPGESSQPMDLGTFTIDSSACNAIAGAPPVYTNMTMTINNNMTQPGWAVWTWNGAQVKAEWLGVGESDTWTSPSFEVSPVAAPANLTGNLTPADRTPLSNAFTTNSDGAVQPVWQFGNGSGGGSSSGTGGSNGVSYTGGSTSGGTNFLNGADVPVGTNGGIVWQASTGAASESTLQTGFNVLSRENKDLLNGESIINTTIGNGLSTITNQLGQVLIYQRTNNDQIAQLVGVLEHGTNFFTGASSTNSYNLSLTNYASESTLSGGFMTVTNELNQIEVWTRSNNDAMWQEIAILTNRFPTNGIVVNFPTNINFSISNYATESTLAGISNSLFGASTNLGDGGLAGMLTSNQPDFTDPFTNLNVQVQIGGETNYGDAEVASRASAEYQGVEGWCASFLSECSPLDIDDNFGDPDMTFDFSSYVGGSSSPMAHALRSHSSVFGSGTMIMDLNPMHNDGIAPLFGFSKVLWTWGLAIAYMMKCLDDARKALEMCENARGVVVTSPVTKKTYT